ncbi:MAG: SOS response-associated peptidase family protein, partial [Bdellovibrionales bacterium]|nr:SOS response-associated peptidase family protein [Bdellovibrionales bacterium]
MCGRAFILYTKEELCSQYFDSSHWEWLIDRRLPKIPLNYNLCPSQEAPVLLMDHQASTLCMRTMRWGLVPRWAKSVKDADRYSMINAKSEEIAAKKSYCEAYRARRCIVP